MNAPRLFLIGSCLLMLNAAAVVFTAGWWRSAGADEPARAADVNAETSTSVAGPLAADPSEDVASEFSAKASTSAATSSATSNPAVKANNPLDHIPIPESLPEIPSLADPETLQSDPGFQEFSRLFSKVEESWEADYPSSARPLASVPSVAYFEALDGRLETVEQLCSAARQIAREAARHARGGRSKQSEAFVQMATQLRDMAAQLLVGEL